MAFFTGVLLSSALSGRGPGKTAVILSLLAVAVMTVLIVLDYDIMDYGLNYMMTFIYYPAVIILAETGPVQRILDRKLFGILGQIAFGIYVWHFEFNVLMDIANSLLHLNINFNSRLTELIVVVLNKMIGFASFYILEKPINRAIKKIQSRAPAVQSTRTTT